MKKYQALQDNETPFAIVDVRVRIHSGPAGVGARHVVLLEDEQIRELPRSIFADKKTREEIAAAKEQFAAEHNLYRVATFREKREFADENHLTAVRPSFRDDVVWWARPGFYCSQLHR